MEKFKSFVLKHFEELLVLTIALVIVSAGNRSGQLFHHTKVSVLEFLLSSSFGGWICYGEKDGYACQRILYSADNVFRD